jgi:hypothetical protein
MAIVLETLCLGGKGTFAEDDREMLVAMKKAGLIDSTARGLILTPRGRARLNAKGGVVQPRVLRQEAMAAGTPPERLRVLSHTDLPRVAAEVWRNPNLPNDVLIEQVVRGRWLDVVLNPSLDLALLLNPGGTDVLFGLMRRAAALAAAMLRASFGSGGLAVVEAWCSDALAWASRWQTSALGEVRQVNGLRHALCHPRKGKPKPTTATALVTHTCEIAPCPDRTALDLARRLRPLARKASAGLTAAHQDLLLDRLDGLLAHPEPLGPRARPEAA